jgi:voltage-gated potassium channel
LAGPRWVSGATLIAMNDTAQRPGQGAGDGAEVNDSDGRLAAYEARTQIPLDLLALVTLWLVLVPPWYFGHDVEAVWWTVRIALSVVYGIDLAIRGVLAGRPVRYALAHPVALTAVLFPPVRVIFSFRLVQSMFRRGHLRRFLLAAAVLVLDGAVIVYLFERHAPHSNIHTLGESLWWSVVTVTTVGYGDYTPVTVAGRITACGIMGIGLLTLAVVTAQVASSFVAQGPSRARLAPSPDPATREVTLAELDRRLARIEELLTVAAASASARPSPERESGGDPP